MQFTKACAKCRQQKTACRAGSSGGYPCHRCEESSIDCVLVEKNRNPAGPTLAERVARQENLTRSLRADLDLLRGLTDDIPLLRSRLSAVEHRRAPETLVLPSPGAHSTKRSPHSDAPSQSGIHAFSHPQGTQATRRDVRLSAIEELEQGHIPTNALGDGARMLGLPGSSIGRDDGSRKRKNRSDSADVRIALTIFLLRCYPTLYCLDPAEPNLTAEVFEARSPLLYWAAVAVGSRESPELEDTYQTSRRGPGITYWDLCGAMVYHKWLSPIRPIGHIVDLAYELGLHRAYDSIGDRGNPTQEQVMRIRLWLTVTIQDYYYSIASGCPPHYNDRALAAEQANWLLSLPSPLPGDYRLAATFEYEELSHSLQDSVFRKGLSPSEWEPEIAQRLLAIDRWYQRWSLCAEKLADESGTFSMLSSVLVNYHLARLAVNTVCLQGIRTAQDVTAAQLKHIYQGVSAARDQCRLCSVDFQPPAIQYVPESTIFAFISSAVFLMKVIRLLPSIEQRALILEEISQVIAVLEPLRDRAQGAFLREMLDHLQTRLRSHPVTRASSPTLGPFGNLTGHPDPESHIWAGLMPQMNAEQSLDADTLWSLLMEPDSGNNDLNVRSYAVDPYDWSVHLNSL